MTYVDGFVIPVPKKGIAAYKKISAKAGKIWKEFGALDYKECVGDDLKIKWGTPFLKLAKAKPGETVVFSWITYKSKAQREARSTNGRATSRSAMAAWRSSNRLRRPGC